jgi:hypothetical protein
MSDYVALLSVLSCRRSPGLPAPLFTHTAHQKHAAPIPLLTCMPATLTPPLGSAVSLLAGMMAEVPWTAWRQPACGASRCCSCRSAPRQLLTLLELKARAMLAAAAPG